MPASTKRTGTPKKEDQRIKKSKALFKFKMNKVTQRQIDEKFYSEPKKIQTLPFPKVYVKKINVTEFFTHPNKITLLPQQVGCEVSSLGKVVRFLGIALYLAVPGIYKKTSTNKKKHRSEKLSLENWH